jgi:hypothetical protein
MPALLAPKWLAHAFNSRAKKDFQINCFCLSAAKTLNSWISKPHVPAAYHHLNQSPRSAPSRSRFSFADHRE